MAIMEVNGSTVDLESYIIQGTTDPTTSTRGTIGQFYKNTTYGTFFKCTSADDVQQQYTWVSSVLNLHYM